MSARDRILARLHQSAPTATPPAPDVAEWSAAHRRQETADQRLQRLRDGLEAAHAQVHVTTTEGWQPLLLSLATACGVRTLLVGSDTALDAPPSLTVMRYEQAIDGWKDQLFTQVDAALTTAKSAIAETGTLILWPDAQQPRLMSLVPPIHFVLLDAATIHADFAQAMSQEYWQGCLPTNALLISGPSKTADIQQTLAYGAHGPRQLIVLVLS